MSENLLPQPIKHKFFTPGTIIITLIALNGLVFLAMRFIFGLGAVTNLNNQYPWGLWIGVDVAAGVALAAGGFVSAAMGHIFHIPFFKTGNTSRIAYGDAWVYICCIRRNGRYWPLVLYMASIDYVEWNFSFIRSRYMRYGIFNCALYRIPTNRCRKI